MIITLVQALCVVIIQISASPTELNPYLGLSRLSFNVT